jgi:3-hydroxyisobutyrate dehydrogenase
VGLITSSEFPAGFSNNVYSHLFLYNFFFNLGVNAARDGVLTFMVGGPDNVFSRVKELLDKMGKNVVHCGPVGTGQAAKICNNMLLAISMIGTSETMNLGIR